MDELDVQGARRNARSGRDPRRGSMDDLSGMRPRYLARRSGRPGIGKKRVHRLRSPGEKENNRYTADLPHRFDVRRFPGDGLLLRRLFQREHRFYQTVATRGHPHRILLRRPLRARFFRTVPVATGRLPPAARTGLPGRQPAVDPGTAEKYLRDGQQLRVADRRMVHRPEPLPARLFDASQRTDPTFDKKHVPTAGAGSDGSQLHRGLLRFRQRTRPRHRRTDLQRTDRRDRKQPGIRPHPVVAPASRQLQNAPQNGDRSVAAPRRHGTAQHRPHAIGEISGRSRSRLLSIAATDRQRDLRAGLPQKTRATIQKKTRRRCSTCWDRCPTWSSSSTGR